RTVQFNGSSPQTVTTGGAGAGKTFARFRINNSGTVTLSGALGVTENVVLSSGTFAAGNNAISVGGDWQNSAAFTVGSSSTVTLNGANNTQTISGTNAFTNLTMNHTGTGSVTAAGSTLSVTGLLHI